MIFKSWIYYRNREGCYQLLPGWAKLLLDSLLAGDFLVGGVLIAVNPSCNKAMGGRSGAQTC
ncbi:hypothetical protein [Chryseobacterium sp. CH1]|uniref:hypothetical protein n=1 Tax=Chryseobacterium sp. CH1 TaxID=713551 RepID=UPI00100BCB5E|nr:hypothetical protein [Chryseobacterium sp. CH1]RXM58850.1 hypothetical protein BOQ60_24645 [Chryseobacterium sp. CH1]